MIDLITAKQQLSVETDDWDSLLSIHLASAKTTVEKQTSKFLTSQNVTQTVAGFPVSSGPILLWKGPVTAVVSIEYDDSNGNAQTLSSFRLVDGGDAKLAELLPAYGASWPQAQSAPGSVRIIYTAGYGDNEIPPNLDMAVLLLTGHFFANREAAIADSRAAAVILPIGVDTLLADYSPPGIA